MKLNDYQAATRSTAIYPGAAEGTPLGIAYCMLGLVSEVSETTLAWRMRLDRDYQKRTYEELKDVLWYIARLSDELDLTLVDVVHIWTGSRVETFEEAMAARTKPIYHLFDGPVAIDRAITQLVDRCGSLSGVIKKIIRDSDGVPDRTKRLAIGTQIGSVFNSTCSIMEWLGESVEQAAQENLDKLNDRMERGVIGGSGDNR